MTQAPKPFDYITKMIANQQKADLKHQLTTEMIIHNNEVCTLEKAEGNGTMSLFIVVLSNTLQTAAKKELILCSHTLTPEPLKAQAYWQSDIEFINQPETGFCFILIKPKNQISADLLYVVCLTSDLKRQKEKLYAIRINISCETIIKAKWLYGKQACLGILVKAWGKSHFCLLNVNESILQPVLLTQLQTSEELIDFTAKQNKDNDQTIIHFCVFLVSISGIVLCASPIIIKGMNIPIEVMRTVVINSKYSKLKQILKENYSVNIQGQNVFVTDVLKYAQITLKQVGYLRPDQLNYQKNLFTIDFLPKCSLPFLTLIKAQNAQHCGEMSILLITTQQSERVGCSYQAKPVSKFQFNCIYSNCSGVPCRKIQSYSDNQVFLLSCHKIYSLNINQIQQYAKGSTLTNSKQSYNFMVMLQTKQNKYIQCFTFNEDLNLILNVQGSLVVKNIKRKKQVNQKQKDSLPKIVVSPPKQSSARRDQIKIEQSCEKTIQNMQTDLKDLAKKKDSLDTQEKELNESIFRLKGSSLLQRIQKISQNTQKIKQKVKTINDLQACTEDTFCQFRDVVCNLQVQTNRLVLNWNSITKLLKKQSKLSLIEVESKQVQLLKLIKKCQNLLKPEFES